MPLADTIKPSDGTRRRTTESTNSLSKKRSGRLRDPSIENGSRGDDVSPSRLANNKKPPAKKTASDNNSEKRAKTPIADKVPKKSVQRAKGSLALNKTIEAEDKKKRLFDVEEANVISVTTIKDNVEGVKAKPDRCKERPVKQTVKTPASERRVPSAKKKNWATVVKKKSGSTLKGEGEEEDQQQQQQQQQQQERQPVEMVPRETKSAEIQPEGVPFSSCSFFEKLQQGVKAYFSSRNSLTEEKPNKKKVTDGGIRTGAGVAKGGKEETKARTQENKINNKIKNLDSDLFYDRPRLKSNSGGQTNNFLNKKPKVLHCLRRKKLYHPKKHYERIQIPRKGYFYRLFEFRPSQSATNPVDRRVEPVSLPTKPEIQIARMASSSPKVSDIYKKRMKKSRKRSSDIARSNDEFALVSSYLEGVNFILNQRMVAQKFEEEVNRIALDWPIEASVAGESISFLRGEKKSTSSGSLTLEWDENPLNADGSAKSIQKFDRVFGIETRESCSTLESRSRNSAPNCKLPEMSGGNSDQSLDVLINCLKNSLGDDRCYGALEISPVTMTGGDLARGTPSKLESSTEALASEKDFDGNLPNFLKEDDCVVTVFSKYKSDVSLKKSKEQFAELLLRDIDLHSEFQNYLQETKIRKANDAENIPPVINKSDKSFGRNTGGRAEERCDPAPDVDAELVQVPFDPLSEIKSPSEGNIRQETREDLGSNTKIEASVTRLETDSKEPPREDRGCVASTDKKDKLVTDLVKLLFKKHNEQLGDALDRNEEVSPKKSKTKLSRSSLIGHGPKDQIASNIKDADSEPDKFRKKENAEADRKITEEDADACRSLNSGKWCPTFDELVDIYSCIIKLNSKRKNFQKSENARSSSLMSVLKDKLRSKQSNADLINFAKTLKEYFKPPSGWKSGADANKDKKLQEYVNMFQEILMSSLSIEQITYLNSVISQVQDQETPSESCVKTINKGSKKCVSRDGTQSESETSNPPVAFSGGKAKEQEPKSGKSTPTKAGPLKNANAAQSKSNLKGKSDLKKIQATESLKKVELSPPAELEKVLKSTFNSENITNKTKAVDKILVNVKVCGSRVLVNDFAYIQDERVLYSRPPVRNKVSELIIEKLTSDKPCKASLSSLSLSPAAPKKSSRKLAKKVRNIKIVLKSTKSGSQKSGKKLKMRKDDPDKNSPNLEEKNFTEIKTLKPAEERKNASPVETVFPNACVPLEKRKNAFEYDQERLKAQHPIDAIIETSESKIMESVESAENIDPNVSVPVERKSSKKMKATELKEASKETMTERPFLKDLINDLGWSNYENGKNLIRTRSYNLNANRDENFILKETSTNEVKFLDDSQLKRGTVGNLGKKNRKIPVRQHNTYFCYPSVVRPDKSIEVKKKTSAEANLVALKKMSSRAAKKADARVVKTTSLKITKRADSNAVKTNSKAMKKSDPGLMKLANQKTVKQTDLKEIKTTSAKPVQKKNFTGSLKRSDAVPTFSRQVAASERLAKKPDRLTKPNRVSPKQKENLARPAKPRSGAAPKADARKNSEHSILYVKGISDMGSEASSINASTASSYFEEVLQQKQKPHSGNSAKSTSSSETAEIIEKCKTSPIVIFSTLDNSYGVTSQFAMIHSDSVLKTLSRSPISPTKIETVFKSHSDLKFYPGRISDSMEEQKPWVKFILTPQQEANADLPSHQIEVVDKRLQAQTDPTEQHEDGENPQIPLESIEKFIDELRGSRLKASRQKELEARKNEKRKLSSSAVVKQNTGWSHCDLSKNVAVRKRDCQKNKSKARFLETRLKGCKKNPGIEAVLAKVIVSILHFLLKQRVREAGKGEKCDKLSESENLRSDWDDGASEEEEEEAVEKWHKLEKTTNAILNAIVNEVTKFEKLVKKKKLIVALKAELKKREADLGANVEDLVQLSKELAPLKDSGKIENETRENETEKETEEQEASFLRRSEEINVVECLLPKENEVKNLGRKRSTYFDAEEKAKGENEGCSKQLQCQSGEAFSDTMLALLGESTTEIKCSGENYPMTLSQSDESLLSRKSIDSETEEIILSKIHESLEENNVYYSMALFDSLLKKKGILDKDEKLQNLLQAVNEKTKALMRDLEKGAWTKLLLLLEEVSRIYDVQEEKGGTESVSRFIANQLNKPLAFIGRIQLINEMTNLQNFLSQSKTCVNDFHLHGVISGFLARLLQMKNSMIPRLTSSVIRIFEDEAIGNNPGHKIRAVKAAQNFYSTSDIPEKKSQLQFLKSQIKDQRLFIEYLVNADSGSSSSEISDVKNRVSEKLKELEKSLSRATEDAKSLPKESLPESVTNSVSLSQASSFLSLTRTCRSLEIEQQNAWNVEACK